MQVENKTSYSTQDLRQFFAAGLEAMHAEPDKTIRVIYGRRGAHRGWAYYPRHGRQGHTIQMSLPGDPALLDVGQFARVFEHEVAHTLGLRHGQMHDNLRYCRGPTPPWAEGRQIAFNAAAPKSKPVDKPAEKRAARAAKPAVPADEVKLRHAEAKLKATQAKVKRYTTIAKKWQRRVRYYQRRLAAREGA